MSADTESTSNIERRLISGAERYCLSISSEFADPGKPNEKRLNELTDDWIKSVVPEVHSPSAVIFICMACACCSNEDWLSARFGWVFWGLAFEGVTSRLKLFKYLLWRFEQNREVFEKFECGSEHEYGSEYEYACDYIYDCYDYDEYDDYETGGVDCLDG
ncbi:hypothetical protein F4801DRAFT_572763 [Xylaria longipes]|nr:hypothetical protein F4801DRAFT_572763 [Xylaria longipes]